MRIGKSSAQIALENSRLSERQQQTFTSTCEILTLTTTPNGVGGFTETWEEREGGPFPCALNVMRSKGETEVASSIRSQNNFILHLPPLTEIIPGDRVTVDEGKTYEVTGIADEVTVEIGRFCDVIWVEGS